MKVIVIFGTRPEAIKMAPLVRELKRTPNIDCIVCVTAQHREMLDQVLKVFDIIPDFDLDIMESAQTLSGVTTKALLGIESVIKDVKPHIVLIHGDTTTAYAGALAAFYQHVPVGHVEAGLRTWDKYSPFPEEMNRQMIDNLSDFHFAPTEQSKYNLLAENKKNSTIFVTGNTAIDALKITVKDNYFHPILDWCKDSRLILLTAHRRENLGEPMRNIFRAINRITEKHGDVKVIYPVHMNPAVRKVANEILSNNDKVRLIEPLDVIDFHNIINASHIIMTDSGGIQEEAPSLGKPVLVLRDTTERPEGVASGTLKLVGVDENTIFQLTDELLTNQAIYDQMSRANNPYGDGTASKKIVEIISHHFMSTDAV